MTSIAEAHKEARPEERAVVVSGVERGSPRVQVSRSFLSDVRSRKYSLSVFARNTKSEGIINTVVLLFSAPTSEIICIRRNSSAAGFPAILAEAADNFFDASS